MDNCINSIVNDERAPINSFEFYGMPVSFHPDEAQVKRKFYELSKLYHPDFYINESEEKQNEILELSTLNNKAFQVLSDPMKRVRHILELYGLLKEGEKYPLPQNFLMEMMDVNEELMEMQFEPDATRVIAITEQIDEIEKDIFDQLAIQSKAFDTANEDEKKKNLLEIKDIYYRVKYILRIRDTLNTFASRL